MSGIASTILNLGESFWILLFFLINSIAPWIYGYFYYRFCRFIRYQGLPRIFSDWGQGPEIISMFAIRNGSPQNIWHPVSNCKQKLIEQRFTVTVYRFSVHRSACNEPFGPELKTERLRVERLRRVWCPFFRGSCSWALKSATDPHRKTQTSFYSSNKADGYDPVQAQRAIIQSHSINVDNFYRKSRGDHMIVGQWVLIIDDGVNCPNPRKVQ